MYTYTHTRKRISAINGTPFYSLFSLSSQSTLAMATTKRHCCDVDFYTTEAHTYGCVCGVWHGYMRLCVLSNMPQLSLNTSVRRMHVTYTYEYVHRTTYSHAHETACMRMYRWKIFGPLVCVGVRGLRQIENFEN